MAIWGLSWATKRFRWANPELLRGSYGPQEVNMGPSGATIGNSKACMSNLKVCNPTQEWIWNIGGTNESIRVLCGPFQGSNWVFKG